MNIEIEKQQYMSVIMTQRISSFEEYIQYLVGIAYPLDIILDNLSTDEIKEEMKNYTIDVLHQCVNNLMIKHGKGSNYSAEFVNNWVDNNLNK